MKILHLTTDSIFFNQAISVFEEAYPGCNDIYVFSQNEDIKTISNYDKNIKVFKFYKRFRPKLRLSEYSQYDLIVFHSFSVDLYPEIFNIPRKKNTIWLGWGFDYYDFIGNKNHFLLPKTKKFFFSKLKGWISCLFVLMGNYFPIFYSKKEAIERLSIFAPVLPIEHKIIQQSRIWKHFPKYVQWNYGTIENDFIGKLDYKEVNGNSILVGNSASYTCNHLEAFYLISKQDSKNREIIVPLSYGDKDYADFVINQGKNLLGQKFLPLKEFLPVQDYVELISRCSFLILNHKRQQALGNIVIMLYLGARIFLRKENPTYSFLIDLGLVVSLIQDLERDPSLLSKRLSIAEKNNNRKIVKNFWSKEAAISRTISLVEISLQQNKLTNRINSE